MLGTLGLIHRLLAMLGSSIRALIARVTIQKERSRRQTGSRARQERFARISTMRAFVVRALSSGHRQDNPCNRPVSNPSMAHLP